VTRNAIANNADAHAVAKRNAAPIANANPENETQSSQSMLRTFCCFN